MAFGEGGGKISLVKEFRFKRYVSINPLFPFSYLKGKENS